MMSSECSDIGRVREWFASGVLVSPRASDCSFVDLVRALAVVGGVPDVKVAAGTREVLRHMRKPERCLFVLVDGMGLDAVNALPPSSFLRRHLVRDLCAVSLSTTACALTTLATGEWPGVHGVPGWWSYVEEAGLNVVSLPFIERGSGRPLGTLGVGPNTLFPVPSLWGKMVGGVVSILPKEIAESVYTSYSCGATARIGYETMDEGVDLAAQAVASADMSLLTYLYLPHLDTMAHELGPDSPEVRRLLMRLDGMLGHLAEEVPGRVRMVVSADHGMAVVPPERRLLLDQTDPLGDYLRCPPSGEATVPIFHVKAGREEDFAAEFRSRYGGSFALVTQDEVVEMGLLGPDPLSPTARRRFGTFMAIGDRPTKLLIRPFIGQHPDYLGVHGGFTAREMQIPLIVQ